MYLYQKEFVWDECSGWVLKSVWSADPECNTGTSDNDPKVVCSVAINKDFPDQLTQEENDELTEKSRQIAMSHLLEFYYGKCKIQEIQLKGTA